MVFLLGLGVGGGDLPALTPSGQREGPWLRPGPAAGAPPLWPQVVVGQPIRSKQTDHVTFCPPISCSLCWW